MDITVAVYTYLFYVWSRADLLTSTFSAAAPKMGSDDSYGVWRIDDSDNSFSTQPFKIRYARQDVPLSVMIAFNVSLSNREVFLFSFVAFVIVLYLFIYFYRISFGLIGMNTLKFLN